MTLSRSRSFAVFAGGLLVWAVLGASARAQAEKSKPQPAAHSDQDSKPAHREGYTDTPKLPDSEWRVHDIARPHPRVVEPGAAPAEPAAPPADAIVLFDGDNLDAWTGRDGKASWNLVDGAMEVNGTGNVRTKAKFGSCQLHIEWMAPTSDTDQGQGRGNSGVFFFDRYEVQVLESHGSSTYADGQAAALYGQKPPDVNACRPAGEWNVFDIVFTAPTFDDKGAVLTPAYVTVIHNGVLVHNHVALLGATRHRAVAEYKAHGAKGPIGLQDHSDAVRFRNVWVRPLED